jgi:hypothetical protein
LKFMFTVVFKYGAEDASANPTVAINRDFYRHLRLS